MTAAGVIAALSDAHEWLLEHPPGLTGSLREAERGAVLDAITCLVNEAASQEQLIYVAPVDHRTQQHLHRVPGGRAARKAK